jgi:hypothetical protein
MAFQPRFKNVFRFFKGPIAPRVSLFNGVRNFMKECMIVSGFATIWIELIDFADFLGPLAVQVTIILDAMVFAYIFKYFSDQKL